MADTHQNRLFRIEKPDEDPIRLPAPGVTPVQWTALAAAPGLSFYVLDGPGQTVFQYDYHGNYLGVALDLAKVIEAQRLGPMEPGGLAVDRSGYAVITDRLGDRLLAFGPGWNFLGTWGQSGADRGSWRRPGAVAVGDRPPFVVADEGNRRLVLVDVLGDPVRERSFAEAPRGVAALGSGEFAATFENEILILGRDLEILHAVKLPGSPGCSRAPYATTAVTGNADRVWVGEGCSGLLLVIPLGGE